jgi:anti-sigma regulatory factor (Ser/Thr protein kinase)
MITTLELHVAPESATPRAVRRAFAEHFAAVAPLDDLLLCVSEVLTNAVLHAGPPIVVVAGRRAGRIRVEISDGSSAAPVRRSPEHTSPTGRGLHLLDVLTASWGVDVGLRGKTVWFEIAEGRS